MLLFLNGIHQYVPYDGYVGLGRFTTFDLAETRIAKGQPPCCFPIPGRLQLQIFCHHFSNFHRFFNVIQLISLNPQCGSHDLIRCID